MKMSATLIVAFMILTLCMSCKALTIGEYDSTTLSLNPTDYGNYGKLQGRLIPIPVPASLFGNKNNQLANTNAAIAAIEKELAAMNARINALTLRADNIKRVYDKTKPQLDRYAAFDQKFQNFNQRLKANGQSIQSLAQQIYQQSQQCNPRTAKKLLDGKCYQLFSSFVTFYEAKATCSAGGKLAEPVNDIEAKSLYTQLNRLFPFEANLVKERDIIWVGFTQRGADNNVPFEAVSNSNKRLPISFFNPTPTRASTVVDAAGLSRQNIMSTDSTINNRPFRSANVVGVTDQYGFICQY